MCVRLNNVRTIKILLSRLVETAVGNVLAPGSGTDFNSFAVFDVSNLTISEEESKKPSTSGWFFTDKFSPFQLREFGSNTIL